MLRLRYLSLQFLFLQLLPFNICRLFLNSLGERFKALFSALQSFAIIFASRNASAQSTHVLTMPTYWFDNRVICVSYRRRVSLSA